MDATMGSMAVLKKFFGTRIEPLRGTPQTVQEFADEVRELSPIAKRELAELAAKEMGVKLAPEMIPR